MKCLALVSGMMLAACGTSTQANDGAVGDAAADVPAADAVARADAAADVTTPPDVQPRVDTCRGMTEPAWMADPSLCLVHYADGVDHARQMAFAPNGDLFVLSGAGNVVVLYDANGDGVSSANERSTFGTFPGLDHSLAFSPDGQWLYASSASMVVRWPYSSGSRTAAGPASAVVNNIPGAPGHITRTLMFDAQGRLYVSVGSASNLDQDPALLATRSQIRRFTIPADPTALGRTGMDYATGEVFASGLRNEVGLTIDAEGRIWGVENGRDNVTDSDFGGDIHNDNPGEEINRFDGAGANFFGYPFCWSEFALATGGGPTTQYGDEEISASARKTDSWCQDPANVRAPVFVMQAHWAPLSITQYNGTLLPADWHGDLFIASHGSWDRAPATGRLIARAHLGPDGSVVSVSPVVGEDDGHGALAQGSWGARPVQVLEGPDGALYFSDDLGGRVFRVGRH